MFKCVNCDFSFFTKGNIIIRWFYIVYCFYCTLKLNLDASQLCKAQHRLISPIWCSLVHCLIYHKCGQSPGGSKVVSLIQTISNGSGMLWVWQLPAIYQQYYIYQFYIYFSSLWTRRGGLFSLHTLSCIWDDPFFVSLVAKVSISNLKFLYEKLKNLNNQHCTMG